MIDLFFDKNNKITSNRAYSRRSKFRGRHHPERKDIRWKYLTGYTWSCRQEVKIPIMEMIKHLEEETFVIGKYSAEDVTSFYLQVKV